MSKLVITENIRKIMKERANDEDLKYMEENIVEYDSFEYSDDINKNWKQDDIQNHIDGIYDEDEKTWFIRSGVYSKDRMVISEFDNSVVGQEIDGKYYTMDNW